MLWRQLEQGKKTLLVETFRNFLVFFISEIFCSFRVRQMEENQP
jgi:hypothetical protein